MQCTRSTLGLMIRAAASSRSLAPARSAAARAGPRGKQPKRPSRQYSIEQFMATTRVMGASFSAGREARAVLAPTRRASSTCTRCPRRAAARTPVTRSKTDSTYAVSYFPKDDRILFTRDQGGNENNHLYVRGRTARRGTSPRARSSRPSSWAGAVTTAPSTSSPTSATRASSTSTATTRKTYARTRVYENNQGYRASGTSPGRASGSPWRSPTPPPTATSTSTTSRRRRRST